jgi:hypothetical protein
MKKTERTEKPTITCNVISPAGDVVDTITAISKYEAKQEMLRRHKTPGYTLIKVNNDGR